MKLPFTIAALLLGSIPQAQDPGSAGNRWTPAIAGQQESEKLWAARQLLRGQDFVGAERAFRAIVEEDPDNGPAWFFLAYCVHALERYEEALDLHLRAAEFHDEYRPPALYNAGCACALLGRVDEAFEWIEAAFAAGFDNRELLGKDPDLDALRDDPRLDAYLPNRCEADPFRGQVRVLYTFEGEAAGDQFGWEGKNAGDCDRDGKADVLISAPYQSERGANAGRVYVYSGATGEVLFTRSGRKGETLGIDVEAAGDVNADGHDDVIVGATCQGQRAGRAYVFSGQDGSTLLELRGGERGDSFGWAVAGVGDMSGDGRSDVAVGAPGSDAAGKDAGRVYVFSGRDGSRWLTLDGQRPGDALGGSLAGMVLPEHKLLAVGAGDAGPGRRGRVSVLEVLDGKSTRERFVIDADESGENLGRMFLSFVGDVDADGFPDVYASDWENNARGRSTGRAYVHSGRTGERVLTLTGEHAGDGFGIGSAQAGDVDGDGHADLIIGAWRSGQGAPSAGKCYLFSGASGELLEQYVCAEAGDSFGFDAVGMGDLDGDGGTDFLITSAWSSVRGKKSGRAFVIAGPRPESLVVAKDAAAKDE